MMRTQRNPLVYSEGFRRRVLAAYPNQPKIKELLDNNQYFLGRYLDDSSSTGIYYQTVIDMIEKGDTDKLLALAKQAKERIEIYKEWDKEVFVD
jgi:hypothetical protein